LKVPELESVAAGPAASYVNGQQGAERFEYVHRKLRKCLYLYLGETRTCGIGVFAAKAFTAGDTLIIDEDGDYYRDVVTYEDLCRRGYALDITLQVGPDAFKLPTGSPEDFTNHSCEPNTGVLLTEKGTVVVALRDIAAHEELTYDYSTYLANPYESMRCRCGAANCRGVIGNFTSLPAELQRRYRALGVIGSFVDRLVDANAAD
jgi:uncharacterized protein